MKTQINFYTLILLILLSSCKTERNTMIVKNGNVHIFTESFGNKKDEPILLIMGATASMLWWDDSFCSGLADRGFYVIRYDNRDTGKSTSYTPGSINYDILDLKADAMAILKEYKIEKANIVGMSLGGMIAQIIAIQNPEAVKTLTLISSGPFDSNEELPGIDQKVLNHFSTSDSVHWTDKQSVIEYMVSGLKIQSGTRHPFNESKAKQLISGDIERSENILSSYNHALMGGGESLYGKYISINNPTLIIHGTEDPVLPFQHAEKLKKIVNSELMVLEKAGHEIHENDRDAIVTKINVFIKNN